jgi:hypothetical protein
MAGLVSEVFLVGERGVPMPGSRHCTGCSVPQRWLGMNEPVCRVCWGTRVNLKTVRRVASLGELECYRKDEWLENMADNLCWRQKEQGLLGGHLYFYLAGVP